jgi:hypothetical protein
MRLSEAHQNMLFEESGISPEVAAERGYYTARRRSEVPDVFKDYQRKPGLVVPMFSPDGETVGYQLRPNKPRKGGPKYETPSGISPVVDVHPRMLEEARHGYGPLLITEGAKTGDAATSRGIPTVVLAGVWMFCVPKVRPYRLKPCFDHIRLMGREVFVAFDSDCMSKTGVQDALAALVAALEERGAAVKVIYLPDAPDGSKQGIDDYLAAGGTVKEMFMLARKFEPADIGNIRMSRDEKLCALVGDLRARWWAEEWKGRGGHSERDVALKLIEAATRSGKVHPDGIRVSVSWGVLQVGAKVARRTLAKALARLEERGFCYRDNEGRKAEKAGAFVLRAKVDQYGERVRQETRELRGCDPGGLPLRAPNVPRLRWSRPKWKPTRKMVMEYRLRELAFLPEPRERIERLGKARGAAVDALEAFGGTLTKQEMADALHLRARDLTRRKKPGSKGRDGVLVMLEDAGVISCEDDVIRLAANWREKLDAARKTGGELEADGLAEVNRKLKSRAYRERDKAPISKPSAAGIEAMRRSRAMRDARLRELACEEEERRKAGPPPELATLISRMLGQLGRLRMGLLCDVAMEEGFDRRDVPDAVRAMGYRIEKLPEYGNEEFVFVREAA